MPNYKSLIVAYLCILCGMISPRVTSGFQHLGPSSVTTRKPVSFLQVSNIDEPPTPPEEKKKSKDESQVNWKAIKEINNKFWEYTCNFLYITISLGILLNLSGYAYSISLKDGLTIRSVSEVRQEMQWNQEMKRYDVEEANKRALLNEKQILDTLKANDGLNE